MLPLLKLPVFTLTQHSQNNGLPAFISFPPERSHTSTSNPSSSLAPFTALSFCTVTTSCHGGGSVPYLAYHASTPRNYVLSAKKNEQITLWMQHHHATYSLSRYTEHKPSIHVPAPATPPLSVVPSSLLTQWHSFGSRNETETEHGIVRFGTLKSGFFLMCVADMHIIHQLESRHTSRACTSRQWNVVGHKQRCPSEAYNNERPC